VDFSVNGYVRFMETPAPAPLQPGDPEQVGAYRLTGRLGSGGMGTVFLGEGPDERLVAVKLIRSELAGDEAFRARFRREADAARRVARFCTASVLEADVDGERPYIVTEYIDGPDLEHVVTERGPLTGSALDALAVGVLTALTAIHGAGVVHRDLKPGNVLLSETGPKVIDFGIAGALEPSTRLTATHQWVGTPAFMAPEQVDGRPTTPAVDVFAWGGLIAYAATGRRPFDGESLARLVYQIAHGEPDLDGLDPELRPLVEQAMARDPERRPPAGELLRRILDRRETPMTTPARSELVQAGTDVVRRTWQETTATAPATGPATPPPSTPPIASPWAPPQGPPQTPPPHHWAPPQPPPPRPPARRREAGPWVAVAAVALLVVVAGTAGAFGLPRLVDQLNRGGGTPSVPTTTVAAAPVTTAEPTGTTASGLVIVDGVRLTRSGLAPWSNPRVAKADVPPIAVAEWQRSGLAPTCPLATYTDFGAAKGATPRKADFGDGQWAVAWDKPGLPGVEPSGAPCEHCGRSVFGIAALENPEPVPADNERPVRRVFDDGSTIVTGPEGLDETARAHNGVLRLKDSRCGYQVWSELGADHLAHLVEHLRFVRN
jgi:serine/threonine protein kinase